MEKYKFKVRKIKENEVEIEGKNKIEVLTKLSKYLLTNDKEICKKVSKTTEGFNVILNEITTESKRIIIDDYDEINQDIMIFLLSDDEECLEEYKEYLEEKNEIKVQEDDVEIDDDLPEEYTEICCENCRYVHTH